MGRRSILERLERLDERGDELATLPGQPAPTAVHQAAVDVLERLVSLGKQFSSSENTPPAVSAMMRLIQHSRPMMLEGFAKVPVPAIKDFFAQLRDELDTIIATPDESEPKAAADDHTDEGASVAAGVTGADQPPGS